MIDAIYNKLIVSCQAREGEPLRDSLIMAKMAQAAVLGGAAAIRAAGNADIKAIKAVVTVPVIGLVKKKYPGSSVYITPTEQEIISLLASGCEIIALDATSRLRPHQTRLADLLALIHHHRRLAMADISTFEEAKAAQDLGFDLVATTLAGYTDYSKQTTGPDLKLIKQAVRRLFVPVIAEGRIYDVAALKKVLKIGPHAVVIGTAITRPQAITERFVKCFRSRKN